MRAALTFDVLSAVIFNVVGVVFLKGASVLVKRVCNLKTK